MGYYIQGPQSGKGEFLVKEHGAVQIPEPEEFRKDVALICVVHNPMFESAAFAYCAAEFAEFKYRCGRFKAWYQMDLGLAKKLTGFRE